MNYKEKRIEQRVRLRLCISIILFIISSVILWLLLDYMFYRYSFLKWFRLRESVLHFLYFGIGFYVIYNHYWKKPWEYFNEIVEALDVVYRQDNETVILSESLKTIENKMNSIKMSILLNRQIAKDAEQKKNELVMYIAHDIRTPLTSVIGYLNLLLDVQDMIPEQKNKYINVVLDNALRLEKMVNEFFEITRYHTQQIIVEKNEIDLYCMLTQVIEEIYPILSKGGHEVKVHMDENMTIYGDSEQLSRVFTNLLKNAASYSYPDTVIDVFAKTDGADNIIIFQNQGQTIDADELSTIFEKFKRLEPSRSSNTGGAGLGLSIAEEIIYLHNGHITAESEHEHIRFIVTIPNIQQQP